MNENMKSKRICRYKTLLFYCKYVICESFAACLTLVTKWYTFKIIYAFSSSPVIVCIILRSHLTTQWYCNVTILPIFWYHFLLIKPYLHISRVTRGHPALLIYIPVQPLPPVSPIQKIFENRSPFQSQNEKIRFSKFFRLFQLLLSRQSIFYHFLINLWRYFEKAKLRKSEKTSIFKNKYPILEGNKK